MKSRRYQLARWMCIVVLVTGLCLSVQRFTTKEESQSLPFAMGWEHGMENTATSVIEGALGEVPGLRVEVSISSNSSQHTIEKILPASEQSGIRVLVGEQKKLEKHKAESPYQCETSSKKWEIVHDRDVVTEQQTTINDVRILVTTEQELTLAQKAHLTELLEFTLRLNWERGDQIRYIIPFQE